MTVHSFSFSLWQRVELIMGVVPLGSLYRGPGYGRCLVQNEDTLLFPGPNASHQATTGREELPHILPNVSRLVARGTR